MQTSYEVALNGVSFHARVGVLPHERQIAQPIEVDVRVWSRTPAGSASGGLLLDYRQLYDLVASVFAEGPVDYLEGVALSVAERAMATDQVQRVRVNVRKPHVPLPGPLHNAEVAIELLRDE
ncbi:MAG: dihydroneopterin aldolase [Gemmatimonadaceae bacterium]